MIEVGGINECDDDPCMGGLGWDVPLVLGAVAPRPPDAGGVREAEIARARASSSSSEDETHWGFREGFIYLPAPPGLPSSYCHLKTIIYHT